MRKDHSYLMQAIERINKIDVDSGASVYEWLGFQEDKECPPLIMVQQTWKDLDQFVNTSMPKDARWITVSKKLIKIKELLDHFTCVEAINYFAKKGTGLINASKSAHKTTIREFANLIFTILGAHSPKMVFKKLKLKLHPDKNHGQDAATKAFQSICSEEQFYEEKGGDYTASYVPGASNNRSSTEKDVDLAADEAQYAEEIFRTDPRGRQLQEKIDNFKKEFEIKDLVYVTFRVREKKNKDKFFIYNMFEDIANKFRTDSFNYRYDLVPAFSEALGHLQPKPATLLGIHFEDKEIKSILCCVLPDDKQYAQNATINGKHILAAVELSETGAIEFYKNSHHNLLNRKANTETNVEMKTQPNYSMRLLNSRLLNCSASTPIPTSPEPQKKEDPKSYKSPSAEADENYFANLAAREWRGSINLAQKKLAKIEDLKKVYNLGALFKTGVCKGIANNYEKFKDSAAVNNEVEEFKSKIEEIIETRILELYEKISTDWLTKIADSSDQKDFEYKINSFRQECQSNFKFYADRFPKINEKLSQYEARLQELVQTRKNPCQRMSDNLPFHEQYKTIGLCHSQSADTNKNKASDKSPQL